MNTLDFKEGQTYICTKSDKQWWTVGKEYPVFLDSDNEPAIRDDDGDDWHSSFLSITINQFKLKEEQPKVMMKELKEKDLEHKYTQRDVNKIIIKAYQTYNNDAQRMAFIKGYFAK